MSLHMTCRLLLLVFVSSLIVLYTRVIAHNLTDLKKSFYTEWMDSTLWLLSRPVYSSCVYSSCVYSSCVALAVYTLACILSSLAFYCWILYKEYIFCIRLIRLFLSVSLLAYWMSSINSPNLGVAWNMCTNDNDLLC